MKIKMLNDNTIRKIAAGEAIVRPVSVIKELVENAIDAGASRIKVDIENGGKTKMTVTDNGCGIAYNEVLLAFERHATSKLLVIEDLQDIQTLGFRGEALASIMAVSKLVITTRAEDEEVGSYSIFEGGTCVHQRVCGHDRGTVIEVSDLFYNLPVRQKHMGKAGSEAVWIRDLVEKMALSHPEIAFSLFSDHKKLFSTIGSGKLQDTVEGIYGRGFFQNLIPLAYDNAPMHLRGYIGNLRAGRSSRDFQIFFVNGRYVRNPALSRAFEEAYEGYLMQHRYPVGIIFIDLPGKMLDVNIHPAKTEIAILNQSLVMILFKQGIRQTLRAEDLTVVLSADSQGDEGKEKEVKKQKAAVQVQMTSFDNLNKNDVFHQGAAEIAPVQAGVEKQCPQNQSDRKNRSFNPADETANRNHSLDESHIVKPSDHFKDLKTEAPDVRPSAVVQNVLESRCVYGQKEIHSESDHCSNKITDRQDHRMAHQSYDLEKIEKTAVPQKENIGIRKETAPASKAKVDFTRAKIIGQLFSTYIVLEQGQEAWIIDQHAAHEAFMYEELRRRFEGKEHFPAQNLLVPVPISVEPRVIQGFDDWSEALLSYGFDCDIFGEDTLMVRSVPVILGEVQEASLICAFLDARFYQTEPDRDFQIKKIITMACKAAVKGNQSLSRDEIRALLDRLAVLENPFTCPHGRPIIFKLREYDLRKMFKRVV